MTQYLTINSTMVCLKPRRSTFTTSTSTPPQPLPHIQNSTFYTDNSSRYFSIPSSGFSLNLSSSIGTVSSSFYSSTSPLCPQFHQMASPSAPPRHLKVCAQPILARVHCAFEYARCEVFCEVITCDLLPWND